MPLEWLIVFYALAIAGGAMLGVFCSSRTIILTFAILLILTIVGLLVAYGVQPFLTLGFQSYP